MNQITTTREEIAQAVVCDIADQFEHSWNSADAEAYADPFVEDADYITIQGTQLVGRDAIAAGAAEIFATIYLDSTIALRVTNVRCISSTAIVAQIEHVLDVPGGPLAGVHNTLATVVIVETDRGWETTTLHNTQVFGPPSQV